MTTVETTDNQAENKLDSAQKRMKKKRLVRRTIVFGLIVIPLLVWLQGLVFKNAFNLPIGKNIFIFVLININVLLILFVLFLVLRNLAEIFFERNRLGGKLKTKLIASFLCLSLIPTILLFFVSLQFVSTSMDYWFNVSVESSLSESLALAQSLFHTREELVRDMGHVIKEDLEGQDLDLTDRKVVGEFLEEVLRYNKNGIDSLLFIHEARAYEIFLSGSMPQNKIQPQIPASLVERVRSSGSGEILRQELKTGDLVSYTTPVVAGNDLALLTVASFIDRTQLKSMTRISDGLEGYRQLKLFKDPFKFSLIIILLIVTLLVVFAAIWFGLHISRGITEPLQNLVDATRRVAEGDIAFTMERGSHDEMDLLVDSFNQMTLNLTKSNEKLAETHAALKKSSQESEQRRKYTEIILQNVSAGVISLDEYGEIITINQFAETLLNIDKNSFIGQKYSKVLPPYQSEIVDGFIREVTSGGKTSVEQYVRLNILGKDYSLLINFTRLEDDLAMPVGFVLVFDNLTKLEQMQRMAAWREVARRIAHEIKNPLTPIQLSAQRLRRRYPEILREKNSVFDQCTSTIITQVEELKVLVGEFSQFARMPKIKKSLNNLTELAEKTLFLYQEGHREISFSCVEQVPIPPFRFDAEQIKRCLINLLENAVAVLPEGGRVDVQLDLSDDRQRVIVRIADNGPGVAREHKHQLFEPYFSTKKTGTGLGLAIVSTIIAEHNGDISVQDNLPAGAVFIIELPLVDIVAAV